MWAYLQTIASFIVLVLAVLQSTKRLQAESFPPVNSVPSPTVTPPTTTLAPEDKILNGEATSPSALAACVAAILTSATALKTKKDPPPQQAAVRALVEALNSSQLSTEAVGDACEALFFLLRHTNNHEAARMAHANRALVASLRAHAAQVPRIAAMASLALRAVLKDHAVVLESLLEGEATIALTVALRSHTTDAAVVHAASLSLAALFASDNASSSATPPPVLAAQRAGLVPAIAAALDAHAADPGVLVALTAALGYTAVAAKRLAEVRSALHNERLARRVLRMLEVHTDDNGLSVAAAFALKGLVELADQHEAVDGACTVEFANDLIPILVAAIRQHISSAAVVSACCHGLAASLRTGASTYSNDVIAPIAEGLSRHASDAAVVEGACVALQALAPGCGGPYVARAALAALTEALAFLAGSGSDVNENLLPMACIAITAILESKPETRSDDVVAAIRPTVPAAVAALVETSKGTGSARAIVSCCHLVCAIIGPRESATLPLQTALGQGGAVSAVLMALTRAAGDAVSVEACLATLGRLLANHEANTFSAVRAGAVPLVVQSVTRHFATRAGVAEHGAFVLLAAAAGRGREEALSAVAQSKAVPALQQALLQYAETDVGTRIAAAIAALQV